MRAFLIATFAVLLIAPGWTQQPPVRGIKGKQSPSWKTAKWINLPKNKKKVDIADYRGKVVYLYCFQSWCPGCHSRGFPTLVELQKRFKNSKDVEFIAVQTAFEGFSTNTFARAKETAKKYKLKIPVGHSGGNNRRSELMKNYRTGGTPWTIIIDKNGIVRFNDFHIKADQAEKLIKELAKEPLKKEEKKKK